MKKDMTRPLLAIWILGSSSIVVQAQQRTDSIRQEINSYVARNFSKIRTFNLTWNTEPSHDYSIKSHGRKIEEGTLHSFNTIKFDVNVPVMRTRTMTLYAIGEADFYNHHTANMRTGSKILSQQEKENCQYYRGGLNAIYHSFLWRKPLILNANLSLDGYNHGIEQILSSVTVLSMLHRSGTTNLSAGLAFVWPFYKVPVLPVITYWHAFSARWSLDATMPRQFYFRYQIKGNNRFSVGTSIDTDQYYFRPENARLPSTCFYSSVSLHAELMYEYIVSRHFYFYAKGGLTKGISGGVYQTNRKDIENEHLKFTDSSKPFLSFGFSYNLFH